MEKCKCPYCMEDIDINGLKYYINKEKEIGSPKLAAFMSAENRNPQHDPFYRFWVAYEKKIPTEIVNQRIVKSYEEMERARAEFEAEAEQLQQRQNGKNPSGNMNQPFKPGQGAGRDLTELDGGKSVICHIKKEMINLPHSHQTLPKYMIYEDGQIVASSAIACPSCYNVLPVEIFDMPLIKIALAADISGGKTCLVLSWFRTLMDATGRGLNSHVNQMDFVPVLSAENGVDEEFREMRIEFERDNICPRGTNKQFVPPVFLKMTYRPSGNKEPHHALVGIYDAAGEVIIQSMRGDMLVYYMSFMDGIVYMIEPSKIGIQQDMVGNHLLVNDASKHFYKQAKLLSPEEQMRVQRGPFSGETLLEIMQKVGGRGNQRENRSNEVLQSLRSYVDDETLKKQYVALTISKCDELQGNPEIAPYNAGNILFLDDRRIDSGQERYRNEQILQLFKDKIFNLSVFDNVFKATSYHMIAAIGCPTEVLDKSKKHSNGSKALEKSRLLGPFAPIRAEEPMLRILSEYAEEHGWND